MKKIALLTLVLLLMAALVVPALADYTVFAWKDNLKVRHDPNKKSEDILTLRYGQNINVWTKSDDGKWLGVSYKKGDEERTGWVQAKYVKDEAPVLYVAKDNLKVYEKSNKDSAVLKKLALNKEITPKKMTQNGEWLAFTFKKDGEKKTGWVQYKYLSMESVCDHEWSKWKVTREATCTEGGSRERTCKLCGKKQTEAIETLPHTYGKWKVTKEATCTAEGEQVRKCKECGKKQTEAIEKLAHTYGDWTVTHEATCTEKGERVRKCKVCGYEKKEAIDMLPHDFGSWNVTLEATDHSSGIRSHACKNCGLTEQQNYDPEGTLRRKDRGDDVRTVQQLLVDQGYLNVGGADGIFGGGTEKALMQFQKDQGLEPDGVAWPQTIKRLNHEFGPWETVKELTRTEPGERVRVCKDCGYEQHETVEAGTTLEYNRRGEDIRALQQILSTLGYDTGKFDGIYGKKLDAAFTAFAEANGFTFEAGQVRPSDVDALINAWIDSLPAEQWMGEGSADSSVNLALTVTPADGEGKDDAMHTYTWTLTNMGSEKCQFLALLLAYGDEADFRKDNLVMVLDGTELKKNCGNSVSGSFTVGTDWGKGDLHFAALAASESTGEKWISNDVVFEDDSIPEAKLILPQGGDINVAALADGIYPVAFNRGDMLSGASGIFLNAVHVYTMDVYDIVDIGTLNEGDAIVAGGATYTVNTLERKDGIVLINGGMDETDGLELIAVDESNCYRVNSYNDLATYTDRGVTTLVLDPSVVYTDSSEIGAEPVTAGYDGVVDAIKGAAIDSFDPFNTTVRIESGKVVEINRVYVP